MLYNSLDVIWIEPDWNVKKLSQEKQEYLLGFE